MERFLCLLSYKFNISLTNSPRLNVLSESINFPLLLIIANFRLWNYKKFTTFPFFPGGTRAGLIYFQIRWKKEGRAIHDRKKPKPKQTIKYKVEHFSCLLHYEFMLVCLFSFLPNFETNSPRRNVLYPLAFDCCHFKLDDETNKNHNVPHSCMLGIFPNKVVKRRRSGNVRPNETLTWALLPYGKGNFSFLLVFDALAYF